MSPPTYPWLSDTIRRQSPIEVSVVRGGIIKVTFLGDVNNWLVYNVDRNDGRMTLLATLPR